MKTTLLILVAACLTGCGGDAGTDSNSVEAASIGICAAQADSVDPTRPTKIIHNGYDVKEYGGVSGSPRNYIPVNVDGSWGFGIEWYLTRYRDPSRHLDGWLLKSEADSGSGVQNYILSASGGGNADVYTKRDNTVGAWEVFHLESVGSYNNNCVFNIRTNNGYHLRAVNNGNAALDARGKPVAAGWELFEIPIFSPTTGG